MIICKEIRGKIQAKNEIEYLFYEKIDIVKSSAIAIQNEYNLFPNLERTTAKDKIFLKDLGLCSLRHSQKSVGKSTTVTFQNNNKQKVQKKKKRFGEKTWKTILITTYIPGVLFINSTLLYC